MGDVSEMSTTHGPEIEMGAAGAHFARPRMSHIGTMAHHRAQLCGFRQGPLAENYGSDAKVGLGSTIEFREERAVVVAQWVCARRRGTDP